MSEIPREARIVVDADRVFQDPFDILAGPRLVDGRQARGASPSKNSLMFSAGTNIHGAMSAPGSLKCWLRGSDALELRPA